MVKRSDIPQPPCSPATVPSCAAPTGRKSRSKAARAVASPSRPAGAQENEASPQPRWALRFVGDADVDPRKLILNPENWRKHPKAQQVALDAALDELGWIQRVIVNKTTGNIVDGHLRVERALAKHERTVPVSYVELSAEEERLALATFDPLSAMATTDQNMLDALVRNIECGNADLLALLASGTSGELAPDFQPALSDEQGDLGSVKRHICPECGHEF